jgi:hypothetical protein
VEYTSQPIKSPRDFVVIEEAGTNVYDFRIQSSAKSLLVVSQVYYSGWRNGGWQAGSSPGRELCSDRNTRARRDHEVHFIFDPVSFKIGLGHLNPFNPDGRGPYYFG